MKVYDQNVHSNKEKGTVGQEARFQYNLGKDEQPGPMGKTEVETERKDCSKSKAILGSSAKRFLDLHSKPLPLTPFSYSVFSASLCVPLPLLFHYKRLINSLLSLGHSACSLIQLPHNLIWLLTSQDYSSAPEPTVCIFFIFSSLPYPRCVLLPSYRFLRMM